MAQTTKRALAASLMKLLKERSLDNITVKDIVEDCEVNRQTFYYHFQDIYDLLFWVFESQADEVIGGKRDTETWPEGFLRVFQYAQENRGMILHVFNLSLIHISSRQLPPLGGAGGAARWYRALRGAEVIASAGGRVKTPSRRSRQPPL